MIFDSSLSWELIICFGFLILLSVQIMYSYLLILEVIIPGTNSKDCISCSYCNSSVSLGQSIAEERQDQCQCPKRQSQCKPPSDNFVIVGLFLSAESGTFKLLVCVSFCLTSFPHCLNVSKGCQGKSHCAKCSECISID